METKTFREVHAELEAESTFLKKKRDTTQFTKKANFLKDCGFINSIATKLYDCIGYNHYVASNFETRYKGLYKFIFEPQLERVCEKYNLFVRDVQLFIADIPETNINHMMNFSLYTNDLPIGDRTVTWVDRIERAGIKIIRNEFESRISLSEIGKLSELARLDESIIQVAAVKEMFSPKAFEKSQSRIIRQEDVEAPAKGQVDLDPIVLCKVNGGYLIITAWGDEANDELVVNQNNN